ncbi:hypothetical protein LT493_42770 [Streptomyces tricolor]|nr:hypothetical protein [Streptomyces tricolor]
MDLTPHPLVVTRPSARQRPARPRGRAGRSGGVPASHIEAVKRSGLLGVAAPAGLTAAGSAARRTAGSRRDPRRGVLRDLVRLDPAPHAGADPGAQRTAGAGRAAGPAVPGELLSSGWRTRICGSYPAAPGAGPSAGRGLAVRRDRPLVHRVGSERRAAAGRGDRRRRGAVRLRRGARAAGPAGPGADAAGGP